MYEIFLNKLLFLYILICLYVFIMTYFCKLETTISLFPDTTSINYEHI